MTKSTKGDSISGRFSGNDRQTQLKRNNSELRKDALGSYLPSYARSKSLFTTPSEDSTNYLTILSHIINDPQYVVDGIILAMKRYHKVGHYDEVVAAQETAFDTSVQAQFDVIGNLIPMAILHDVLSNPPTDEANATTLGDGTQTNVKVALYDRDTLATIIQDMNNSQIEVLPIVVEILKLLFFHVKVREEEKIGGVYSPGENIVFGLPKDTLATHNTNLASIVSNKGKFKKYCNMFGIPTVPFKEDMITSYNVINGIDDPKFNEYMKYHTMAYRDGAGTIVLGHSSAKTFTSATPRIYWKDNPNENIDIFMACKLAYTQAANNLYGGLCITHVGTVQDNVNIVEIYQDDATQGAANGFDGKTLTEDNVARLFSRFAASDSVGTAVFGLAYTGTDLAADHIFTEPHQLIERGIVNYKDSTTTIIRNALLKWIGDKLNLTTVSKGGK